MWRVLIPILLLAGCDVQPEAERNKETKAELESLDSPDVASVKDSFERNALKYLEEGNYQNAAGLYRQLFEQDDKEVRYQLGLAESLRRLREYKPAIEFYDLIIERHPGHLDAFEGKALALMGLGETKDAGKIFKRILDRDDTRWRSLNASGVLFAIKNLHGEAEAYFNAALKYSADNPSVLNNLGLVQALQRRYRQSVETLEKASQVADDNHRRHVDLNLALVHGINGNVREAKKIAERHLEGAALENNMGLYAHLANDAETAKSYLNMALSGSSVYYERAWSNLDIIAKEGRKPGEQQGKSYKVE